MTKAKEIDLKDRSDNINTQVSLHNSSRSLSSAVGRIRIGYSVPFWGYGAQGVSRWRRCANPSAVIIQTREVEVRWSNPLFF